MNSMYKTLNTWYSSQTERSSYFFCFIPGGDGYESSSRTSGDGENQSLLHRLLTYSSYSMSILVPYYLRDIPGENTKSWPSGCRSMKFTHSVTLTWNWGDAKPSPWQNCKYVFKKWHEFLDYRPELQDTTVEYFVCILCALYSYVKVQQWIILLLYLTWATLSRAVSRWTSGTRTVPCWHIL